MKVTIDKKIKQSFAFGLIDNVSDRLHNLVVEIIEPIKITSDDNPFEHKFRTIINFYETNIEDKNLNFKYIGFLEYSILNKDRNHNQLYDSEVCLDSQYLVESILSSKYKLLSGDIIFHGIQIEDVYQDNGYGTLMIEFFVKYNNIHKKNKIIFQTNSIEHDGLLYFYQKSFDKVSMEVINLIDNVCLVKNL